MGGGIRGKVFRHIFDKIISLDNLFLAWDEFKKGKRKKPDVQQFEYNLENNMFNLHQELKTKTYQHSNYTLFYIKDPKLRKIHKACVKDRVLRHAVFRILYPIFDKSFISDSYSCRINKGTHRAINRLQRFTRKASKNNSRTCFILKCDIKKFFDSIDQDVLINLIKKKIKDSNTIWLIEKIIKSFNKGLPLGNITSQLFANIYLNELDQFVKHRLRIKDYIRYCDDFLALDSSNRLEDFINQINIFLRNNLKLSLHPDKIIIRRHHRGIDFLGYVSFPHHRTLRPKTKKRMFGKVRYRIEETKQEKISKESFNQTIQSYFGILKHCKSYKLRKKMYNLIYKL